VGSEMCIRDSSNHSKAERVFGKRGQTTLPEGVQAMAEWVKEHGARASSVFENIEVAKNMPPSWARATLRAVGA